MSQRLRRLFTNDQQPPVGERIDLVNRDGVRIVWSGKRWVEAEDEHDDQSYDAWPPRDHSGPWFEEHKLTVRLPAPDAEGKFFIPEDQGFSATPSVGIGGEFLVVQDGGSLAVGPPAFYRNKALALLAACQEAEAMQAEQVQRESRDSDSR